MTPELAHDYIRRRMSELNYGDKYHIRFRHFLLNPHEERTIEAGHHLFILAAPRDNVRVQSEIGVFDVTETAVNELQYEHQGTIVLTNYSQLPQHVMMIQVIIKSK